MLVFHHNVLPRRALRRMGLANWRNAHRRLLATGADVILCGHDHQEGAGQIDGSLAVSTSGTHSHRSRGGRPSVFNLVTIDAGAVHIQHYRWEPSDQASSPAPTRYSFARAGPPKVAVSRGGRRSAPVIQEDLLSPPLPARPARSLAGGHAHQSQRDGQPREAGGSCGSTRDTPTRPTVCCGRSSASSTRGSRAASAVRPNESCSPSRWRSTRRAARRGSGRSAPGRATYC